MLNKMAALHKEAQDNIGRKDSLLKYTVKSNETETINTNYKVMHDEITNMVDGLEKKVKADEEKFVEEFTDRLRKLHARYRELEKVNIELSSMTKLTADIDEMMKERDELNAECSGIDARIRVK